MDKLFYIGIIAGTLTTSAFLPQVVQAAKTKQTKDLSLAMFVVTAMGLTLWIVYGVFVKSAPIILANTVTLALVCYLIFLKVKYG